jgi:putative endonuclease
MADPRRTLGRFGERLAEKALRERGWAIVARNARTRYGEIDLVCHDGKGFVFIEVKTRKQGSFVSAVEACGPQKLHKLVRLSEAWLALHGSRDAAWRPAVMAITFFEARSNGLTPAIRMELLDVDPLECS